MMMIITMANYIAQFDTNGIITTLHTVTEYTQTHYVHI